MSAERTAVALRRSAIGDPTLETAIDSVVRSGIDLSLMVTAGLITLEPDVDGSGGGWWAELEWWDVLDALTTGRLRATPFQTVVLKAAVAASRQPAATSQRCPGASRGKAPTSPVAADGSAALPRCWAGSVLVVHDDGPRAGHIAAVPAHLMTTYLVYDGPEGLGVYRRTSPLRWVITDRGAAEVWTVVQ